MLYSGLPITEREYGLQKTFKKQMNNVLGDEIISERVYHTLFYL